MNWVTSYRPGPGRRGKINLNFYFHAFLWCIKRIYEGRKSNTPLWMFFHVYLNCTNGTKSRKTSPFKKRAYYV